MADKEDDDRFALSDSEKRAFFRPKSDRRDAVKPSAPAGPAFGVF